MKILVTGGNGFIGKHLIQELSSYDHKIFILESNILNKSNLIKEIENTDFDVVIHLAGLSHVMDHSPILLYETNVIGSQNLVSAIEKFCEGKKVLLASTCHVYEKSENPIAEISPLGPKSHYGASKLAMEFICNSEAVKNKIISLRLFNCIGFGQKDSFIIPKIIKAHIRKEFVLNLGNIDVEREFNDVKWTAAIIRSLAEIDIPEGVYNLCSGFAYSARQILKIISEKTFHFPDIITDKNLLRPNEQRVMVGNPKKLTKTLDKNNIMIRHPSIDKIIERMISEYRKSMND